MSISSAARTSTGVLGLDDELEGGLPANRASEPGDPPSSGGGVQFGPLVADRRAVHTGTTVRPVVDG